MGYQSFHLAVESCGARRGVPARIIGQASTGRSGTKRELAERAKVAYYPRCTIATHVSVPPAPALNPLDPPEA